MPYTSSMALALPEDSPLRVFTDDELEAILAAGRPRDFGANETIFAEGQPGDSMFVLLEGRADAQLGNGLKVRSYGPGSYFGELSFINPGHLRSATLCTTAPSRLRELTQQSIQSLIVSHPNAIFTLLRRTCAFLVNAERSLITDLRARNTELQETIRRLEFTRARLSEEEMTARTDGLSGLYNRRAFDAELPGFMQRAKAINTGLALLAMDLDHFKPVNDTLGHGAGDAVLRGVGKVLQAGVRRTDLPCRIGGDEFVILLTDLTEEAAKKRAEALREAIGSMPHPGNEQGIRVTTTMGGTMLRPGETAEEFTHRADEALYAAKRGGRNRVGWL